MKIGIVTPGGFDKSGVERVIPVFLWLVERLARKHDVHVFTLDQYPDPVSYSLLGATVHNVGYRGLKRRGPAQVISGLAMIRAEHARARFDVFHGLWAGRSGLVAVMAGKLFGAASVVTVAGGEMVALPEIGYGGYLTPTGRLQVNLAIDHAGAVTSAAEFTRRRLQQRRPDARLIVLGADTGRFLPAEESGRSWRLLHVASLNKVKDQHTLIRAFRIIREAEPAVHLDIVGQDTLDGAIQAFARDEGVADSVTFHGFQPSDVVSEFVRRAHLLLHTSVFEDAGPLVFLEAAACGVPTVGTSVGVIDDLSGTAAVAVPVGDHEALAREAIALLRDDEARRALGRRALEFAVKHNADWTTAQFEALYCELVEGCW